MKHLLSIDQLGREGILDLVARARKQRDSPNPNELVGKTVVNCFFEDSTRTRVSFEIAAKRLGAICVQFASGASSLNKGESMRNTIETLDAMNIDALVVRHSDVGTAERVTQWTNASVINAGDGINEHPTQALLDVMTLLEETNRQDLSGMKIAMIGDFDHSRVANSTVKAFSCLGAEVVICGPPALTARANNFGVVHELDDVLAKLDVAYSIRPQSERMKEGLISSMDDYVKAFSITEARLGAMPSHGLVMDAGPLVRNVQMSQVVEASPRTLVNKQVTNGVFVRMAVLSMLIGPQ